MSHKRNDDDKLLTTWYESVCRSSLASSQFTKKPRYLWNPTLFLTCIHLGNMRHTAWPDARSAVAYWRHVDIHIHIHAGRRQLHDVILTCTDWRWSVAVDLTVRTRRRRPGHPILISSSCAAYRRVARIEVVFTTAASPAWTTTTYRMSPHQQTVTKCQTATSGIRDRRCRATSSIGKCFAICLHASRRYFLHFAVTSRAYG